MKICMDLNVMVNIDTYLQVRSQDFSGGRGYTPGIFVAQQAKKIMSICTSQCVDHSWA